MPLVIMARGRGTQLIPLGKTLLDAECLIRGRLSPLLKESAVELERQLTSVLEREEAHLRLYASHDLTLSELHALLRQQYGVGLTLRFYGCQESLRRLQAGECDLAGFHLPEGVLGKRLARQLDGLLNHELVVVPLLRRRQGLMTHPKNPSGIVGLEDPVRPGIRFVIGRRDQAPAWP